MERINLSYTCDYGTLKYNIRKDINDNEKHDEVNGWMVYADMNTVIFIADEEQPKAVSFNNNNLEFVKIDDSKEGLNVKILEYPGHKNPVYMKDDKIDILLKVEGAGIPFSFVGKDARNRRMYVTADSWMISDEPKSEEEYCEI